MRPRRCSWSQRDGRFVERAGYVIGTVLLASGVIHLAILIVSGASWLGPLSLRKPATFGLSFGLTLLTTVWVATFLPLSDRTRSVLLGTFIFACAAETALVSLQAWRGVPSHFNLETPFDAIVARTLAAGGLVLIVTILVLTLAAFRANPGVASSLRIAIRIGFAGLVGALIVGALMIAKGMTLVFRGNPQAAYATAGSLKPVHAVMMHAVLALPGFAWLLSFTDWPERRRVEAVLAAAAAYAVLAAVVIALTSAGR